MRLPTLFVTHDFRDAAALADRVGVILDGRLRQLDAVGVIGHRPADAFVATLTGGNLLAGEATPIDGGTEVALDLGATVRSTEHASGRVGVAVYPWEVAVAREPPANGVNAVAARWRRHPGGRPRARAGRDLLAECGADDAERLGVQRGAHVWLLFDPASARIVDVRS